MGFAVNASTHRHGGRRPRVGFLSPHIDRGSAFSLSLILLAIPPRCWRVAPTSTYSRCCASRRASAWRRLCADARLSRRQCSAMDAGGAFAAYITGNVASNLFGRLYRAVVDHLGLASNFYSLPLLNLAGAVLVYFTIAARQADACDSRDAIAVCGDSLAIWRNPALRSAFAIGFCILFASSHLRCEFCAGPRTVVARTDGSRLRLLRLCAFRRHDAVAGKAVAVSARGRRSGAG